MLEKDQNDLGKSKAWSSQGENMEPPGCFRCIYSVTNLSLHTWFPACLTPTLLTGTGTSVRTGFAV